MLHLPRNKTLKIIQGLLQTDGTYRGKEILLELASRPLVEAVRYMLLRLGIGSSGYTRNRVGESHITKHGRRITTKQPTAVLRVPKVAEICDLLGIESGKFVTYVKHDGMIWSRVESKEFIDYEGVLTDFDIDTNHNYLTHVGLAHNGGGKRPGSHAIYLSPHHADIHRVLDLKRQRGNDQERARHLFYAMWMPDEFYRCIQEEARLEAQWRKEGKTDTPKLWYLMCPDQSPGLDDLFDAELAVSYLNDNQVDPVKHAFTHLYRKYIAAGRYVERVSAQELWRHICEVVEETGIPYICDKDAGNRKSNQQNLGTIKSSNLCVAPETMILTKKGYYPIADLVDQQVQVWNGSEWSRTTVRQTSENAELLKIKFSDGAEIQCTRKHKFYIEDGNSMMEYAAEELTSGLKLIKFDLPDDVIDQEDEFLHPYSHGFFCGDGLYTNTGTGEICQYRALPEGAYCVRHKDWSLSNDVHQTMCQAKIGHQPIAWLYGEKKALFDYLDLVNYSTEDDQQGRQRVQFHPLIAEKFVVPLNCSRTVKIQWFAGYCDADGTLAKNGNNISLQVGSVNYEFLMRIRLMLQTMGIHSKVTKMRGAEKHLLPDGHGNQKEYQCQPMWRLLVNSYDLWKLKEMGFNPHRLDISEMKQPQRSALQFVSVESVEVTGRYDKTYCFTEPKRHMGVFNGILTGQCTEIYQYSSPTETAVCNLASICLPRFITTTRPKQADKFYGAAGFDTRLLPTGEAKPMWFDFAKLHRVVHRLVRNLNKVIDINYYPIPETKRSNFRHRPMGIGVQGLADLYTMLRMPFDSEAAQKLNFYIFESIYYAALEASANEAARYKSQSLDILQKRLARMQAKLPASSDDAMFLEDYQAVTVEMEKIRKQIAVLNRPYGGAYASYEGSPISKGLLQFDLWNKEQEPQGRSALLYPLSLDWTILRALIAEHGVRNSLLLAPMPTGSTSTVMNCSACFEPHNSLVFKRRNRVGEVTIVNKYLIQDLMEIGMWNEDVRNAILKDPRGSIADIARIPRNVRQLYKTVWDVDAKAIVDQALCRGVFVDQSQSMSLFMQRPTHKELTKLHFYSWRRGIKTASYYTRRLAPADAQKIQVVESNKKDEAMTCPRDPKAAAECLSCQ
jgi:ribonucleoside-diphosphate reductase alpha chain